MNTALKYFQEQNGYARMKDLKQRGIQTRDIKRLVDEGRIEKIKAGLYRLTGISLHETSPMVEVCLAMPKAVVCLTSALAYHGLTTYVPDRVTYALPRGQKPVRLDKAVEGYHFSQAQYEAAIEETRPKTGRFRIYGPEKTICDCFRFRNKIGEDIALEGLKNYLNRRDRDLKKLMIYARICRAKGIMSQYVKALLA